MLTRIITNERTYETKAGRSATTQSSLPEVFFRLLTKDGTSKQPGIGSRFHLIEYDEPEAADVATAEAKRVLAPLLVDGRVISVKAEIVNSRPLIHVSVSSGEQQSFPV